MALVLNPFGLAASGDYIGGKPRQSTLTFPIVSGFASNIVNGDVVSLTQGVISQLTAPPAPAGGLAPVTASAQVPLGVFVQAKYQPATGAFTQSNVWLANTATSGGNFAYATVSVDTAQVYYVQANGPLTAFTANTTTPIGLTFNLGGEGAGNTTTATSGMYLLPTSYTAAAAGNCGHVTIIGLAQSNDVWGSNAWSDAYPVVKVVLNNAVFKTGQYSL